MLVALFWFIESACLTFLDGWIVVGQIFPKQMCGKNHSIDLNLTQREL